MVDDDDPAAQAPRQATVKVVGPCKSGKSTLVAGLRRLGYAARGCAQEHSDVPTMWQRIAPADWLIYLDVSLETIQAREQRSDWSAEILAQQQRRLTHARQHSHLIVSTDDMRPSVVLDQVVSFLQQRGVYPAAAAGDSI
jgi:hypothetical protein